MSARDNSTILTATMSSTTQSDFVSDVDVSLDWSSVMARLSSLLLLLRVMRRDGREDQRGCRDPCWSSNQLHDGEGLLLSQALLLLFKLWSLDS